MSDSAATPRPSMPPTQVADPAPTAPELGVGMVLAVEMLLHLTALAFLLPFLMGLLVQLVEQGKIFVVNASDVVPDFPKRLRGAFFHDLDYLGAVLLPPGTQLQLHPTRQGSVS